MRNTSNGNDLLVHLLAEVSTGNDHAFSELYRLTRAYLYMVALRLLRQPSQAEEVVQEAYLSVWTHAWRFRPGLATPMTWLITIVRNHSLDILRKENRERQCTGNTMPDASRPDGEEDSHAEPLEDEDAMMQVFFAGRSGRLRDCIAQLDPPQRQSVVLAFYHGMSHTELAAHLDAPLGTVKSWLRRGLARLRKSLEHPGTPLSTVSE